MNILVINGSPKGDYSVTLQTSNYLAIKFPDVIFDVIHAGQYIRTKKGMIAAMYLVGSLANNEKIKAKMGANIMNEGMLMPYKKVIEKAKKQ